MTLLAALIPIIGALYAASSVLVEHVAALHEVRVRRRLRPLVQDRYQRLVGEARASGRVDWDRVKKAAQEFETRMLTYSGIATTGSYDEVEAKLRMSRLRLSPRELRRQWVLLLSAACGVILLAVDALITP